MKRMIMAVFVAASLTQLVFAQEEKCKRRPSPKDISNCAGRRKHATNVFLLSMAVPGCSDLDFGGQRCDYLSEIESHCNGTYIFPTSKFQRIKDNQTSPGSSTGDAIYIRPQKVSLELKPNAPLSFKIENKQADDYPLDLYYLMDLTGTMRKAKAKLESLADELAGKMRNMTSKLQVGFGSFIDKSTSPFTNTHPNWIDQCNGCIRSYLFRNHMALNTDTRKFKKEVKHAKNSINFDLPEGGLEALLQALVCKDEINWRENSRKLVVFATDGIYHVAGDGKLGGVVRPNDEKCHLDSNGYYTMELQQDYPSVSQIRKHILKHQVNVIFAAMRPLTQAYRRLSKRLSGSTVEELKKNSSNVVEIVENYYKQIRSSVTLVHNAKDPIKVKFFSSCLGKTRIETDTCNGIGIGESVAFEAEIQITSCPEDRKKWNQTFQIYPFGLNQPLTVDIIMACECDCEKPWYQERQSYRCSAGNGTFECGICSCNKNRLGKKCQCEAIDGETVDIEDTAACIRPGDTVECSGKGKCICGRCECFIHKKPGHKTTGEFCECDSFSCDKHNGLFCGGPKQGICDCGECKCLPGWIGNACECTNSTERCISPNDTVVCSGHGDCECGKCICKQTKKDYYTGKYCEKCVVCLGNCEKYKSCVWCKGFQSGPLTEEECEKCSGNYTIVEELGGSGNHCYFEDDEGCRYFFTYSVADDGSSTVEIKRRKECPEPVDVHAVVLGVIGGIVAIGIATLIAWKIITSVHDSREYAIFIKEQKLSKWKIEMNPLYKEATSTFLNPSFGNDN